MSDSTSTPPIETQPLTSEQACDLERQIGFVVAELFGPPIQVRLQTMTPVTHDQARAQAKELAGRYPDRSFVVFRPSATYHGVSSQPGGQS
jgi:hypothetical protein